ncbi:hypothetical protein HY388_02725 [Candidatus Daviesbacteria bacterium]|nr:hypothetical protein [Candidatus Daviesbacteria bacterium]
MIRLMLAILFLALIFRIAIAAPYYSGDVNNHIAWGKGMVEGGTADFYSRQFTGQTPPNYPPVPLYLFAASYWKYQKIQQLTTTTNILLPIFPSNLVPFLETINAQAVFLKFPAIFFDLLSGLFIFKIAGLLTHSQKLPVGLSSAYLFNPAVFYNSANWGQIESIPIALMLGSVYYLMKNKPYYFTLLAVLSLLSKQTIVVVMPALFIAYVKKFGTKVLLFSLVVGLVTSFILYWPLLAESLSFIPVYIKHLSGVSNYVSDNAFNLWGLIFGPNSHLPDQNYFGILTLQIWGYVIFSIFLLPVLYVLWKNFSWRNLLFALTILSFSSFLFLTRIHERHLASVLPLLLLLTIFNSRLMVVYAAVSLAHFINLYHGFWQPNLEALNYFLKILSGAGITAAVLIVAFAIIYLEFFRTKGKV